MLGQRLALSESGLPVTVVSPGIVNTGPGPDFSDSMLLIDGTKWVGNVEIHVHASDWFRHGHHNDPAYDSVILHVVAIDDTSITRADGNTIPQTAVTFPPALYNIYSALSTKLGDIRCRQMLHTLADSSAVTVTCWLESLAVERMQAKAERILQECKLANGDWQKTCFVTLARALGFNTNSLPFEMLARSLSLNYLARHSDNILQLEALLFGQAGMLDMSQHIFDEYYQTLCREYYFLARKYGLRPLKRDIWKYGRPYNFPGRRIAILASALSGGFSLLADIIERQGDMADIRKLFTWRTTPYWESHFDFETEARNAPATLSEANIDLLMINMVAPLLYAYGASHDDPELAEKGLEIWSKIKSESNSKISQWRQMGIRCETAMRSQALLQLRNEYCDRERCLECRIGHSLIRKSAAVNS